MSLPTDSWAPGLLRALAEYAPGRAVEAAARYPFVPALPASTMILMAQWIHDGCEVVQVSAEAGLELSHFGPLLHEAIHLPSRVVGVQMEGTDAISFLRPDGERLAFLPWTRDRDGTWRSIAEGGVQHLSMLDLALGAHPLIVHSPQSLRMMINGLAVARTQELLPALPPRAPKPSGRKGVRSPLPPARRLLLDVSALYTWRSARAERQHQAPAKVERAPSAPRAIHHVAQHMRRVRVRVEGELRIEWRPVAAHARGSARLLVRRDRVTTGVGDLRSA